MTYYLDTSCIIRWLLWDVPAQAEKIDALLRSTEKLVHIADIAIIECMWVLKSFYEFDDDFIGRIILKLIEHKKISCNKRLFTNAIQILHTAPKVSVTDVYLVLYAQTMSNSILITFDKKLHKKFPKMTTVL